MAILAVLMIMVVLAAVVYVLSAPLRKGHEALETKAAARRAELEAAKDAKYREIRDAEMDFQTGKLDEADHRLLDRQLRAEAMEILHALDAEGLAEDDEPAVAPVAAAKGAEPAKVSVAAAKEVKAAKVSVAAAKGAKAAKVPVAAAKGAKPAKAAVVAAKEVKPAKAPVVAAKPAPAQKATVAAKPSGATNSGARKNRRRGR